MTRNLKALGLALIAVFAMSAVVASAAHATLKVTAASYPATLTATQSTHSNGESLHTFTVNGRVIRCSTATFHGTLTEASASVTITPAYSNCTANLELPVTVTMEGCDYLFHGGSETSEHHFVNGLVDLVCPAGGGPTVHIYTDPGHSIVLCTYRVTPFVNHGGVTYTNTTGATDDVDLVANGVETTVHRVTGSALSCGAATQTALYTGSATAKAYEDPGGGEGSQIGLTVSEG